MRADFVKIVKKWGFLIVFSIFAFLFVSIWFSPYARADYTPVFMNTWISAPDNIAQPRLYNWVDGCNGASPIIKTDSNGYHWWDFDCGGGGPSLAPTTTQTNLPTNSAGWKLWRVGLSGCGNSDYFFWYDTGNNLHYSTSTQISSFIIDGNTNYLCRYEGLDISNAKNLNEYGTPAYFIVYTPDDLSWIINADSLYQYLNILNITIPLGTGTSTVSLTPPDCADTSAITYPFCKVLVYLFYPSATSTLGQFSNLADIIAEKPPFGYYNSIKGYLNAMTSTGTPAFTLTSALGDITLFATLKTGIAILLWIAFAVWVIRRIGEFNF